MGIKIKKLKINYIDINANGGSGGGDPEIPDTDLSNAEIWYKTSDNKPITISGKVDFGATFVKNEYDSSDGYCKIYFDSPVTQIVNPTSDYETCFIERSNTLTEIVHLPSSLTKIGNYFVRECTKLTNINLQTLTGLTEIGNYFCEECSGLTSINLSVLTELKTIGNNFFAGCSGLTSVDLSSFGNVTSIDYAFLTRCSGITQIKNMNVLKKLTKIESSFCYRCTSLKSVDLSAFENVTSIGGSFLSTCTSLEDIDLRPLKNVKEIGTYFLSNSTLKNINLSFLISLERMGHGFLGYSTNIKTIDLTKTKLKTIFETNPLQEVVFPYIGTLEKCCLPPTFTTLETYGSGRIYFFWENGGSAPTGNSHPKYLEIPFVNNYILSGSRLETLVLNGDTCTLIDKWDVYNYLGSVENIYVKDSLLDEYKEKHADQTGLVSKFRPMSELPS